MSSGYYNKGVETGAKAQNAEWFASDIDPGIRPGKLMEITLQISVSATAAVVEVTLNGGTTWSEINTGVAIPVGKLHSFSMFVKNDDLINFRATNASGTVLDVCYVIGDINI